VPHPAGEAIGNVAADRGGDAGLADSSRAYHADDARPVHRSVELFTFSMSADERRQQERWSRYDASPLVSDATFNGVPDEVPMGGQIEFASQ
jgi:hypothetical protein